MNTSLSIGVKLPQSIDVQLAHAAWQLIKQAHRIVLLGHFHPDGDALGSTLGFGHALTAIGKSVTVAVPDAPDEVFAECMPGFSTIVTELSGPQFDLVIALDAGDSSRYGEMFTQYAGQLIGAPTLNMDHHITSAGFGDVNIIDVKAAAAAELVTLLLDQIDIPITTDAAKCLLTGIITDTRSFEYDATTARTMLVGAYLLERGAVPFEIIKPIFRMKLLSAVKLSNLAISTIDTDANGKLIWLEVTPEMWKQADLPIGQGDEGLPSYLIDIHGVEISVVFRQNAERLVRVSIRTTQRYDATKITTQFGGGGHPRAAGCTLHTDLAAAKKQVLAAAKALLDE